MKTIGVRRRSIRPSTEHYSRPVPGNIAKKFGCEKLTEFHYDFSFKKALLSLR
jgi:hypothetical protein